MPKFIIEQINTPDDDPFDRQNRISWWDQKRVNSATVMVVGAGAIGNETLKNLALLGVRNIFIVDFDEISTSNLSRTVLFRKEDAKKRKAPIAAERTRELCLAHPVNIDWFDGDIVWELGTGVYRRMSLVLGCLDNVETRFAINRECWKVQVPWIDAGIRELRGHVSVFSPPETSCYQCNATEEQLAQSRLRYSCDDFKRAMLAQDKVPTVQIASALVSALQVQEAMKLICEQRANKGRKVIFEGLINDFDNLELPLNPKCLAHVSFPAITSLPISNKISLRGFLGFVSQPEFSGEGAILDFRGDRTFVVSVNCRSCGTPIEFLKPSFRIYDTDTICSTCKSQGIELSSFDAKSVAEKVILPEFGLEKTDSFILDKSLYELGVPFLHILTVRSKSGHEKYYELALDEEVILPSISKAKSK